MSDYVSNFATFTKLDDGLKVKIHACTVDRIEQIANGTRIIQESLYVDVAEAVEVVEELIVRVLVELDNYQRKAENRDPEDDDDGEEWKRGFPPA